jgi:hypothetical protein
LPVLENNQGHAPATNFKKTQPQALYSQTNPKKNKKRLQMQTSNNNQKEKTR